MRTPEANQTSEDLRNRTGNLQFSVQVTSRQVQTYVAAFNQYGEALKWAEALAARLREEGSQQTVNVWDERQNKRVHVIYAPLAESLSA